MTVTYEHFERMDIRVGKIIGVQNFSEADQPILRLLIDFGQEIGTKVSGIPASYGISTPEELMDMLVICAVNAPPQRIDGLVTEVLTLGFKNSTGDCWVLATPSKRSVNLGDKLQLGGLSGNA